MRRPPLQTLIACLALMTLPAVAQDTGTDAQATRAALVSLVKTLLDQNVLTPAKARELLRQAGLDPALLEAPPAAAAAPPAPATPPVRVPYVPEAVKRELRDEIRQEVIATARAERWAVPEALPAWLGRFSFGGDLRLRGQREDFADDNAVPAVLDTFYQSLSSTGQATTRNTTEDRGRLRWRARLGVGVALADDWRAQLRLVTSAGGDANDPASTNVDAGQAGRRYGAGFDLANLSWSLGPYSASVGRIGNPYQTTDLLWSNDLTLDGLAASWRPVAGYELQGFVTAGVHPLREVNASSTSRAGDSWLYAVQAGGQWRPQPAWSVRAGLGLFEFHRVESRLNPAGAGDGSNTEFNDSAPLVRSRGNTMFNIAAQSNPTGGPVWGLASKFRVVDVNAAVEYTTPQQWRVFAQADWLQNVGYDAAEIRERLGVAADALPGDRACAAGSARLDCERTRGMRVEFGVGHGPVDEAGTWALAAGVRELQRDAVPDGWTTGDYRGGGTDVRAGFASLQWGWARNVSSTLRYVNARSIDLPVTYRIGTWQLDLNARF
jgi:hypothetical protein